MIPLLAADGPDLTDPVPFALVSIVVAALVTAVITLYRALRESEAEKLKLSTECATTMRAYELDGQQSRMELHHKLDAVVEKIDRMEDAVRSCTGAKP